jgi:14-3-3 protein epsilon
MKVRMADLWKPVKGVTIKEAPDGKFLFHFAHPIDMETVLNGGPWTFDNNMLILEQVQLGMQIERIPLFHVNMWVQVHNLPMGLMKETVGTKLANYIGVFMEYDKNNKTSFWRQFMRIRVKVDVRLSLKKDAKVKDRAGEWCTVNFKYEKLGVFCFVCGVMGHAENKCVMRFSMEEDNGIREWSADIRADARRQRGRITSRWLREERGSREEHGGDAAAQPYSPSGSNSRGPVHADVVTGGIMVQSHTHNPHQAAIMTRQDQSFPINDLSQQQLSANQNASTYQLHPSFQSLLARFAKDSSTNFNAADNSFTSLPNINSPPATNSDLPIITAQPVTETHKTNLFPNQPFTFNSRPAINTLSENNLVQTNNPNRPKPDPANTRLLPELVNDPKSTRPKKPKNNPKKPHPTHN